ncbi:hypothetical protein ACN20G_04820 [Streptomyces sp. BI20]|uniref:hypothetical protein n=1 Tax=Streptomyces sp. BI20 TaxID=3403460 RepID=UPI003C70A7A4
MAGNEAAALALARAEQFIWLTARVLEQRRFAFHFLGAEADPVETALGPYLNPDGGYGHALDPDLRGPLSQPLHTLHALRVLDSLGRCEGRRVERVCRHLTQVSTPEGALPSVLPVPRSHPVAPQHRTAVDLPADLVATGPVVGLLHRNRIWHAWLFRATDFCWQRVESARPARLSEIPAAVAFLDGAPDPGRAAAAADRLGRVVRERGLVTLDPDDPLPRPAPSGPTPSGPPAPRPPAGQGPAARPSSPLLPHEVAPRPDSAARAWFTDEEMDRSLTHLAAQQQEDGGWPARRRGWTAGAVLEQRPIATIEALLTLRAYGRLPDQGSAAPTGPGPGAIDSGDAADGGLSPSGPAPLR